MLLSKKTDEKGIMHPVKMWKYYKVASVDGVTREMLKKQSGLFTEGVCI